LKQINIKNKFFLVSQSVFDSVNFMSEEDKYDYLSELANKQSKSRISLGMYMEGTNEGVTHK
jgi:hypothetical protein